MYLQNSNNLSCPKADSVKLRDAENTNAFVQHGSVHINCGTQR